MIRHVSGLYLWRMLLRSNCLGSWLPGVIRPLPTRLLPTPPPPILRRGWRIENVWPCPFLWAWLRTCCVTRYICPLTCNHPFLRTGCTCPCPVLSRQWACRQTVHADIFSSRSAVSVRTFITPFAISETIEKPTRDLVGMLKLSWSACS